MPNLNAKFEGMIPSHTHDTYIDVGFKAINSGDARFFLRELMKDIRDNRNNVVFVKHGQEDWTNNLFRDESDEFKKPYKTKLEVRIFARSKLRARQELAQLMVFIKYQVKKRNIYKVRRHKADWSDK